MQQLVKVYTVVLKSKIYKSISCAIETNIWLYSAISYAPFDKARYHGPYDIVLYRGPYDVAHIIRLN